MPMDPLPFHMDATSFHNITFSLATAEFEVVVNPPGCEGGCLSLNSFSDDG